MTAEDEQKAMLADDLSAYIKEKHTQEECVGFIDGYNAALTKLKLLGIADVVDSEEGTELPESTIPEFGTDEWIDCCEQLFGGIGKSR